MQRYSYDGPVMEFDRVVMNHFKANTSAVSERKALNNLAFQFKRQHNKSATARISLPGKLVLVD